MQDLFKKGLFAGLGAVALTREKAEKVVQELVRRGEVQKEEAVRFVDELVERGRKEQVEVRKAFGEEMESLAKRVPFATKQEVATLQARLIGAEERLIVAEQRLAALEERLLRS